MPQSDRSIVLAGGCFWCTEAVFSSLKGVSSVLPGYSGGTLPNPTYQQVCTGNTGHAEAVQVVYDSALLSLRDLLTVFFATHDPTSLNRQGHDSGTEYRSAIFCSSPAEKKEIEDFILEIQPDFDKKIVTEVRLLENFYPAEDYHRNYYADNRGAPYCEFVISPKITKLHERFAELCKNLLK